MIIVNHFYLLIKGRSLAKQLFGPFISLAIVTGSDRSFLYLLNVILLYLKKEFHLPKAYNQFKAY